MIIEIAISIAAIAFVILVFFLVRTLLTLQRTLKKLTIVLYDVEQRIKYFDSTLRCVANLGDVCEYKTQSIKKECLDKEEADTLCSKGSFQDLAEWLLLSASLGTKIFKRR